MPFLTPLVQCIQRRTPQCVERSKLTFQESQGSHWKCVPRSQGASPRVLQNPQLWVIYFVSSVTEFALALHFVFYFYHWCRCL